MPWLSPKAHLVDVIGWLKAMLLGHAKGDARRLLIVWLKVVSGLTARGKVGHAQTVAHANPVRPSVHDRHIDGQITQRLVLDLDHRA